MRVYIEFARKKFSNNMVYRFDYIIGIINTCLQFFIFWCIYKSLYGAATEIDGVTFPMVATNFILSLGLSNAFQIDDLFLQRKIGDGSIVNEFLKPVNFKLRLIAENIGNITFRLIFNFLPAFIIAMCFVKIEKPATLLALILFASSAILGFFVLWQISFIVQMTSFWIINVWSISTIKNVFVNVLSGAMLPLWFMPKSVMRIIKFTPFDSIYFTPIRLYLGDMQSGDILFNFGRQIIWICILYIIGDVMWRCGQKKLIVQGG
jgi:ABC-2 type transport system permease protein